MSIEAEQLRWLEAAKDNFEEAIESENLELAKDIIQDMKDIGYKDEALFLERQLEIAKKEYEEKYS